MKPRMFDAPSRTSGGFSTAWLWNASKGYFVFAFPRVHVRWRDCDSLHCILSRGQPPLQGAAGWGASACERLHRQQYVHSDRNSATAVRRTIPSRSPASSHHACLYLPQLSYVLLRAHVTAITRSHTLSPLSAAIIFSPHSSRKTISLKPRSLVEPVRSD